MEKSLQPIVRPFSSSSSLRRKDSTRRKRKMESLKKSPRGLPEKGSTSWPRLPNRWKGNYKEEGIPSLEIVKVEGKYSKKTGRKPSSRRAGS